jgi:hypothetical protein
MATQPVPFGSNILVDAWNSALGIFERWVDHELGIGEVAISQENQAAAAALDDADAPIGAVPGQVIPGVSNTVLLVAAAGLALVAYVLLSK